MKDLSSLRRTVAKLRTYLLTGLVLILSVIVYVITLSPTGTVEIIIHVAAAGLVPACLVGLLWEFFIRDSFQHYVHESLGEQLRAAQRVISDDVRNRSVEFLEKASEVFGRGVLFDKYAIKAVYRDREDIHLVERVRKAQTRIWILVTSFSYVCETGGLLMAIRERAREGVKVRILGLAPDTESARLRSAFSDDYQSLNEEIPLYRKKLKARVGQTRGVDIRLYDKIPTCACFFVDSDVFFCSLLCNKRGRDSTHLHVSEWNSAGARSELFTEIRGHFERLFDTA